jgi:hypothetical protein
MLGLGLGNAHLGQDEQFSGPFAPGCAYLVKLEWLDARICPFSPSGSHFSVYKYARSNARKVFPRAELAL